MYVYNLTWPDPIFAQGRYRFQYKRPTRKGSGLVHRPDWNWHFRSVNCLLHHMVQFESTCAVFLVATCLYGVSKGDRRSNSSYGSKAAEAQATGGSKVFRFGQGYFRGFAHGLWQICYFCYTSTLV